MKMTMMMTRGEGADEEEDGGWCATRLRRGCQKYRG
jgi:hypothetical protein